MSPLPRLQRPTPKCGRLAWKLQKLPNRNTGRSHLIIYCQLTGLYYYVHYWKRFWCWMRKMLVHVVWNIIALKFKWRLFSNEQINIKLRFCLYCPFLYSVIIFLKSWSFLVNEHYILLENFHYIFWWYWYENKEKIRKETHKTIFCY